MANGDTKTESYLRAAAEGTRADLPTDTCCNTKTQNLILGVANRIMDVEDEVEELKNNPDVVDIVDTYADLQAYDTSTLTDKDIIRVLEDSTHSNSSTYYRWNATTNQFDYIGEAGGSGPTVVQTTGTSTTNVMSQNAVTSMIFNDPQSIARVQIGNSASATANSATAVGRASSASGAYSTAVGYSALVSGNSSVVIGRSAVCNYDNSVGIGYNSRPSRAGEVNVGCPGKTTGYKSTAYRVIGGVHDGIDAHDAATVGQLGVKVLTEADNNYGPWNSGTISAVAAWLLPSGWYTTYDNNGLSDFFIAEESQGAPIISPHSLVCVRITGNGTIASIFAIDMNSQEIIVADVYTSTGFLTDENSLGSFSPRDVTGLFSQLDELWNAIPWADSGAPDSSFFGTLGQLYTDTDTMHTYQCTAIDDSDPDNIEYTWTQRW